MSTPVAPPAADRRAVRSWIIYDWANSAFTATVVAAVFPVYYASVAGATLPSAAAATRAFALTTSLALGITAILSPILGSYSDLVAAKKRLLGAFMGAAASATAALVLVGEGDWLLASALFVVARIGFGASNVVYDALLPAVAAPLDRDRVSAQGFAMGYLGGGLLLTVNVAMIFALPDGNLGVRASFVTVGVWWAMFSLPLLKNVPEPPPTGASAGLRATVRQVRTTLADLRRFQDLRRFLFAFLIYNDGINTVIAVAALYGNELGFGTTDLILAILMVQFVAVPFSLLFGRISDTSRTARRRGGTTVFLLANIVLVPILALGARVLLPADIVGRAVPAPPAAAGEAEVGDEVDTVPGMQWAGQDLTIRFTSQPGGGSAEVLVDGRPVALDGEPVLIETDGPARREGDSLRVPVGTIGSHELTVLPIDDGPVALESAVVLAPRRTSDLRLILGMLVALQGVAGLLALGLGGAVGRHGGVLDTRGGILLSLCAYLVIAVWGFALDSVAEFWSLAWLVAVVQGGSQSLSRSLYTVLTPDSRAGEFFGLFSVLSKAAAFLSPLLFVVSVTVFDSSRPAVLSLAVVFAIGIGLVRGVDVGRGRALAASMDGADTSAGQS